MLGGKYEKGNGGKSGSGRVRGEEGREGGGRMGDGGGKALEKIEREREDKGKVRNLCKGELS